MHKPSDSVRIVLLDPSDKSRFLILTETDDPNNWKLPGGKFDPSDETPDKAATRELAEELQFDATVVNLTMIGELKNDDGVSARYIYQGMVSSKDVNPSNEVAKIQWVTAETVPDGPNKNHILSAIETTKGAQ